MANKKVTAKESFYLGKGQWVKIGDEVDVSNMTSSRRQELAAKGYTDDEVQPLEKYLWREGQEDEPVKIEVDPASPEDQQEKIIEVRENNLQKEQEAVAAEKSKMTATKKKQAAKLATEKASVKTPGEKAVIGDPATTSTSDKK